MHQPSSSSSSSSRDAASKKNDHESSGTWTDKTGKFNRRKTISGASSSPYREVQAAKKIKEKIEPRYIVYLWGTAVKPTSSKPVSVERESKSRYNYVESIQLRGVSLKITCKSERDKIQGCTSLGETSVVASQPYSEERGRVKPFWNIIVLTQLKTRLKTRLNHSSSESANAISLEYCTQWWQSCRCTTTRTKCRTRFNCGDYNSDSTVHPTRRQVLPMSRLRSCRTFLLQTERRMSSMFRLT